MLMYTIISMGCLMDWAHADQFCDNTRLIKTQDLQFTGKNTQNPSTLSTCVLTSCFAITFLLVRDWFVLNTKDVIS